MGNAFILAAGTMLAAQTLPPLDAVRVAQTAYRNRC